MLLTKAPAAAAPIPANLSAKPKPRILEPNWNSSLKRNERGLRLVVRGGYTRTPMETPGAYQLIDDDTGEKFIVWGGGSDDAPIPSKHTLSWKPSTANTLNEKEQNNSLDDARDTTTSITGIECVPATTARGSGNFGRLKAQRVRALVKNTSQTKQNVVENDDKLFVENRSFGKSVISHPKLEHIGRKQKENAFRNRRIVAGTSQPQEARDMMKIRGTSDDFDHSDITLKQGFEPCLDNLNKPAKHYKSDTETWTSENSAPRVSARNLRGWGSGGSTHNFRSEFRSESFDRLKQRRKLSTANGFFSKRSFRDLGCSEFMIESLKKLLFLRPSHIQAMTFPPVIDGKSCIIADQSGSGKTLAYLAPIIQRLREEELRELSKSSSQNPRVVIMVPTAELASQVLCNCRAISKFGVPFKSMVVTGGFRQRTQLENLQQGVDILIATPGRFLFLINEGFLQLTNLRCAVLDEVDILFNDEDFEVALKSLINYSPVTTQYLFATATLPREIYNKLVEVFPDCEVIMGPGMHRISPGLEEVLVDCSGEDGIEKNPETSFLNKKTALLQLAERSPVSKTIVFCNKIDTCRKVENVLKRCDRKGTRIQVLPFHSAVAQESRLVNFKEFTRSQADEVSRFLVCTDRASRGIDFTGVDHVVLFDFPRDPSEYVRRVGRTARGAGGKGKAFIFVVGKQVSLARKIMERNEKGHPLHDLPCSC